MRREIRIFAYRQTINQGLIQKLRPPYPLWSVDRRGAGQYHIVLILPYIAQRQMLILM